MKGYFDIIRNNRTFIKELAVRDFKNQYIGSFLGILWTFVQPLVFSVIIWLVFAIGFKSNSINNFPFVVFFLSGLFPWNFFSDIVSKNTTVIADYGFLVKKIKIEKMVLPLVKVVSSLIIHLIFCVILILVLIFYGFYPKIYWLFFLYYTFSLVVFSIGLSFLLSSVYLFFKDLKQIVNIILQLGFWITPIFWDVNLFDQNVGKYLKLNPLFYIIQGYRESFLENSFSIFFEFYTFYFWGITISMLIIGVWVYKKLSSHFADVV